MKKVFLILIVLFYGCNSNENQIANIEIMSYYYKPSENYERQILDYLHYSIIDENGKAETIKKIDNTGKRYAEYKSIIDKNLLNEISRKNLKLRDKYYDEKTDKNIVEIYCGPITRVKIKFKDNHIITFNYSKRKDNSKYLLFMKLYNNLENNFSDGSFSSIDKVDLEKLKNKHREFEKYTINKDTLNIPLPPPLKINSIKFLK
jgi:hypothetical protein